MAAALLTSPMAIAFVLAVALASGFALTRVWHPSPLPKQQLALGYLGVVVVCLIVAAVSAYVSPEDAVQRWHIPRDQYWASLFRTFALLSVVLTCLSILGVAVIGAPIIFALASRGLGRVPYILAASIIVSLVVAFALAALTQPSSATFARDAPYLVGLHLLLSLGFCIGAGLPWSFQRSHA